MFYLKQNYPWKIKIKQLLGKEIRHTDLHKNVGQKAMLYSYAKTWTHASFSHELKPLICWYEKYLFRKLHLALPYCSARVSLVKLLAISST